MSARRLDTLLTELAAHHGSAVGLYTDDAVPRSFAEIAENAGRMGQLLPGPGQRVAVRLSNDLASVEAIHAVWSSGCSVVAIGDRVPADEVARRLDDTGAVGLLDPGGGSPSFERSSSARAVDPGDEAVVLFTSGTTGRPKAASLTRAAVIASCQAVSEGSGQGPDGRIPRDPPRAPRLLLAPLAHAGGLLGTVAGWYLGAPLLVAERFSADLVFELAQRFELKSLGLTPAMIYDLAFAPGERSLPGIATVASGTAALPEATRIRFEERYGIPILRNYGQTEFIGAIAFERYGDIKAGNRPEGSVGRIAPGVEVRIRDADGNDLPAGEIGEICARGPNQMAGYLNAERRPGGVPDDGFLATGDLGFVHDGDMLTVVGRVRDVIICGGFNVYPATVEAAINAIDGIADSAVGAVADDRLGEVPVALVVHDGPSGPTPEAVLDHLRTQMAPYELPRRVQVVDALPRTHNGKIDRPAIAARFA